MATLAEQIKELCAQHDLTCVSLSYSATEGVRGFYAYAHGGEKVGSSGHHASPAEAIQRAIVDLAAERAVGVAVIELEAA